MTKLFILIGNLLLSFSLFAQPSGDTSAPYFKNKNIPAFVLLRPDSTLLTEKELPADKKIMLIYFNPECDHCQHEAKEIEKRKDSLENICFIWTAQSYSELPQVQQFAEIYGLTKLKSCFWGKEIQYKMPLFYRIETTPYAAVYKNGKMLAEYRGHFNMADFVVINYDSFTPTVVIEPAPPAPVPEPAVQKKKSKKKKVKRT